MLGDVQHSLDVAKPERVMRIDENPFQFHAGASLGRRDTRVTVGATEVRLGNAGCSRRAGHGMRNAVALARLGTAIADWNVHVTHIGPCLRRTLCRGGDTAAPCNKDVTQMKPAPAHVEVCIRWVEFSRPRMRSRPWTGRLCPSKNVRRTLARCARALWPWRPTPGLEADVPSGPPSASRELRLSADRSGFQHLTDHRYDLRGLERLGEHCVRPRSLGCQQVGRGGNRTRQ